METAIRAGPTGESEGRGGSREGAALQQRLLPGWGWGRIQIYSHMPEAKVLNPEKFSWTLKLYRRLTQNRVLLGLKGNFESKRKAVRVDTWDRSWSRRRRARLPRVRLAGAHSSRPRAQGPEALCPRPQLRGPGAQARGAGSRRGRGALRTLRQPVPGLPHLLRGTAREGSFRVETHCRLLRGADGEGVLRNETDTRLTSCGHSLRARGSGCETPSPLSRGALGLWALMGDGPRSFGSQNPL